MANSAVLLSKDIRETDVCANLVGIAMTTEQSGRLWSEAPVKGFFFHQIVETNLFSFYDLSGEYISHKAKILYTIMEEGFLRRKKNKTVMNIHTQCGIYIYTIYT